MRSHPLVWFLLGGATSLAPAQSVLLTHDVPASVRKIVTHDHGWFWYAAMVRHLDGSVTALGNPWLGGGARSLTVHANDLARLDAFTPGDNESVAVVGNAGLSIVTWDAPTLTYTVTPAGDAGAIDGVYVRAAKFPSPYHTIAVVPPGGNSVRVYRDTTLVATPTVTGQVHDLEIFQNASGAGLIVVCNDTTVSCVTLSGTVVWSQTGYSGRLVRWPQSATVRVACVNRTTVTGGWRVSLFGDSGLISNHPLGWAIPATDNVVAAFAADADEDGDIDLTVKTNTTTSVFVDATGSNPQEVDLGTMSVSVPCIPDLLSTDDGRRLRLVDQRVTTHDVAWTRVDLPVGQPDTDGISLEVTGPIGGHASDSNTTPTGTHIDFRLIATQSVLTGYASPTTEASLQVVAWRQEESVDSGRMDPQAELNWLYPLSITAPAATTWKMEIDVAPQIGSFLSPANGWKDGWLQHDSNALYWLTVRLCSKPLGASYPTKVSEPITLATSMAMDQYEVGWTYIQTYSETPTVPPPMLVEGGTGDGGGIVGAILKTIRPPPPPPGAIPAPRNAVVRSTISPQE